jgi:Stigma-specific protein, Stig1
MAEEVHNGASSPSENPTRIDRSLDDLARVLATSNVSRGRVLKIMGGALLGSVLASVPGMAWAACPEGQTRCGDRCVNLKTNERHCGSCRNRCRSTQTCCGGRCVNLQTNERHCGRCYNRCAGGSEEGDECVAGVCQGGCPSGTIECGTECCQTGETCVNGTCCPNARVCGTGTSVTCCAEGEECVRGVCLGSCTPGTTGCCSGEPGSCFELVGGGTVCARRGSCHKDAAATQPIANCNDCPPGSLCAVGGDCPNASVICVLGSCVPPTGPNGVICTCPDGFTFETCTSADCSSGEYHRLVCDPLCPPFGSGSSQCAQNSCLN